MLLGRLHVVAKDITLNFYKYNYCTVQDLYQWTISTVCRFFKALNYKTIKTLSGQLQELKNKGKVQLGNPQKLSRSLMEVVAYESFSLQS